MLYYILYIVTGNEEGYYSYIFFIGNFGLIGYKIVIFFYIFEFVLFD